MSDRLADERAKAVREAFAEMRDDTELDAYVTPDDINPNFGGELPGVIGSFRSTTRLQRWRWRQKMLRVDRAERRKRLSGEN